jgi:predicted alpha/beta superfamily hydrolase
MEKTVLTLGEGLTVTLFPGPAPLVLLLTDDEAADAVLRDAAELAGRPFAMAAMAVEDWNDALSPWPAEEVFRGGGAFGGKAEDTVRLLETRVLPEVRAALASPDMEACLAGYSLAGLFAVYTLYRTAAFGGAVSASGSLWYPGFTAFAREHAFPEKPRRIVLSLGDRESRTKNPLMQKVEEATRSLCGLWQEQGIDCSLRMDPGNHFRDPELRLSRSIAELLAAY